MRLNRDATEAVTRDATNYIVDHIDLIIMRQFGMDARLAARQADALERTVRMNLRPVIAGLEVPANVKLAS